MRIIVGGKEEITIVNITKCIIEQVIEEKGICDLYSFLKLKDGNILCGCGEGLICIYDTKMKKVIKGNLIHYRIISDFLNINDNLFISCSWDNNIKIWEY